MSNSSGENCPRKPSVPFPKKFFNSTFSRTGHIDLSDTLSSPLSNRRKFVIMLFSQVLFQPVGGIVENSFDNVQRLTRKTKVNWVKPVWVCRIVSEY